MNMNENACMANKVDRPLGAREVTQEILAIQENLFGQVNEISFRVKGAPIKCAEGKNNEPQGEGLLTGLNLIRKNTTMLREALSDLLDVL